VDKRSASTNQKIFMNLSGCAALIHPTLLQLLFRIYFNCTLTVAVAPMRSG